ncbi:MULTISPECIES: sulfatase-like hydrolase/transferase [unclassified Pseudoalteromonas]|uniref:sulfatase-like hydrolase/transferase n=1 Tax=unclassified Pseudoalteromonas TaxID=194690 RepID=UPI0014872C2B|nr:MULTISPECIES: sulfatase-like hydrolase/transferase [unclassified Pseudoalteromonas]
MNYPSFEFKGTNFKDKLESLSLSLPLLVDIIKVILGLLLSILFFSIIAYTITHNLKVLAGHNLSRLSSASLTWALLITLTLGITSYQFPYLFFSHETWVRVYIQLPTLCILILLLLSSFFIKQNRLLASMILVFGIFSVPINLESSSPKLPLRNKSTFKKKNVVIIGIDSLNTRLINSKNTPFISSFVNTSIHLPNTHTHVARTFPSWFTILTGNYPTTTQARLNLTNLNNLNLENTLSYILKKEGYTTYFSLDERRFSHIDESFYFDKVIGPSETVSELLIWQLVDNPFLAVTSQLPIFTYFLPQLQNNRGAWKTYSPPRFNKELEEEIKNTGKPVFIAAHFTLPHWPYKTKFNTTDNKDTVSKYLDSVKLADKQVERFHSHLKSEGILENALIFIITDHGESFARKIDQPENSSDKINIAGHGTSIISSSQFNVLLSFKEYNKGVEIQHTQPNTDFNYALTDITPTILDRLNINLTRTLDGSSIFKVSQERFLPIESSLKPSFNVDGTIDLASTIKQGISFYEVNELGRAVLKNKFYPQLVSIKQRGVIFDKWQLSIFPELDHAAFITDLDNNYLYNLNDFYDKEITFLLLEKLCSLFSEDTFQAKAMYCKEKPYLLVDGKTHGKAAGTGTD